ncbi:hypothetical protein G3578_03945 [Brevibacillus sp. SYP-B805]|uniref:hypothetical protein n=1 Tax=Brevibacillus sp. SYP-B805 TaxID=1578199 RepID=UPI0013EB11D6|nr:hypothetical protein [Brevibacillus sp. SYP-B805]NGQ94327.1 hypothetical protein [Brevibacillus sp. SYP-B805]
MPNSKAKLKDEQGYAALVAILVILLLTLLGTNLLQVTLGSLAMARKTEARGESQYLARMGMEEALARLDKAVEVVNDQIEATGKEKSNEIYTDIYLPVMRKHFPESPFTKTYPAADAPAKYELTVTREPKKPTDAGNAETELANPSTPIVEKFTIEATGTAPAAYGTETARMKAVVYVSTIPEEFHYVLSTPIDDSIDCQKNAARCYQIVLNGSPFIRGDIYSNTFTMRNTATYYSKGNEVKEPTTYPSVVGQLGSPYAYVTNHHMFWEETSFVPDISNISSEWYKAFVIQPTLNLNLQPAFGNIRPIAQVIGEKRPTWPSFGASDSTEEEITADQDIGATFTNGGVRIKQGVTLTVNGGDYVVNGVLTMDGNDSALIVNDGNLYIAGNNKNAVNNQAAFLRGTVDVGDGHMIYIDGNAVFEDLTCNEPIYINGDLRVQGSFNMNATVYVKGNVQFTEEETNNEENPGTLVILAGGKVELFNLSMRNSQKTISSFVYTEAPDGITLYGVASNYRLYGGIHAKKIELNAVRGDVMLENGVAKLDADGKVVFDSSHGPLNPDPNSARLKVEFNPGLFENPPPGIPIKHRFSYYIHEFATLNNP